MCVCVCFSLRLPHPESSPKRTNEDRLAKGKSRCLPEVPQETGSSFSVGLATSKLADGTHGTVHRTSIQEALQDLARKT